MSYCEGCIDYESLYCTECGRSKFTEDKGFQTKIFPLIRSVESQTEEDTNLQGIQNIIYMYHTAGSEKSDYIARDLINLKVRKISIRAIYYDKHYKTFS